LKTIDYARYRSYDELTQVLKEFEEHYPELLTLKSIGKSLEGRDIWVADVTNKQTGPSEDKPAAYFDANIHAGEVTGSTVALYLIGYLLEHYGTDELVTHLLDTRAFYVVPRVSVDGAEVYLSTPQTLRSSTRVRPRFEVEEGIWPEDIDGDGQILNMRVKSPRGEWKVSEHDSRLMIPREPGDFDGEFYHVFTEGRVHHGRSQPPNLVPSRWDLDLNRNFPANWKPTQPGSGRYPLSEPESRAQVEFVVSHPNISTAVAYHTAAGIIMRAPNMQYDREMNRKDFLFIKKLSDRGTDLTGYPHISGYLGWSVDFPMEARGNFCNWAYDHMGLISYTIELWDMATAAGIPIERNYGDWWSDISEEAMLRFLEWNDREIDGKGFKDWEPFDHPELGEVEIGGWVNKWTRQNPPEKYLPELMHKNAMFAMELAVATPRVTLTEVAVEQLSERTRRVAVEVSNTGFLPTNGTEQAKRQQQVCPVEVALSGEGIAYRAGDPRQVVGHLEGYGPGRISWGYLFNDRANDSAAVVEWVVEKSTTEPVEITITARGARGGTARTALEI